VESDPEYVLRERKAVCAGYAKLFVRLCQEAGIESDYLTGHSREYGGKMNEQFRQIFGKQIRHAWNAVKLGGQWHLLDVTWGAGHIDDERKYVRSFNPHFFLTTPVDFIHTHYPEDPKWQLLPRPIERPVYDQLVHARSGFFRNGLTLMSHRMMNIEAAGEIKITLGAPRDVVLSARVKGKDHEVIPDVTLAQRKGKTYEIRACFPTKGTYHLQINSRKKGGKAMEWALGYKVRVRAAAKECRGYPITFGTFGEHDVYLTSPMMTPLPSDSSSYFSLQVPGAEMVYGVTGSERFILERDGQQFSGQVVARPGGLILYAQFPGQLKSWGILDYRVR
jgi:transglutaminase/protease-like cytokinesis protein 3